MSQSADDELMLTGQVGIYSSLAKFSQRVCAIMATRLINIRSFVIYHAYFTFNPATPLSSSPGHYA